MYYDKLQNWFEPALLGKLSKKVTGQRFQKQIATDVRRYKTMDENTVKKPFWGKFPKNNNYLAHVEDSMSTSWFSSWMRFEGFPIFRHVDSVYADICEKLR